VSATRWQTAANGGTRWQLAVGFDGVEVLVPVSVTESASLAPTVATGATLAVPTSVTETLSPAPLIDVPVAGVLVQVPLSGTDTVSFAPTIFGTTIIMVPLSVTESVSLAPTIDTDTETNDGILDAGLGFLGADLTGRLNVTIDGVLDAALPGLSANLGGYVISPVDAPFGLGGTAVGLLAFRELERPAQGVRRRFSGLVGSQTSRRVLSMDLLHPRGYECLAGVMTEAEARAFAAELAAPGRKLADGFLVRGGPVEVYVDPQSIAIQIGVRPGLATVAFTLLRRDRSGAMN
jgi:hypothetical protein